MNTTLSPSDRDEKEIDQSLSSPSDIEIFDFEDIDEEFIFKATAFVDNLSEQREEEQGCGTPLNLELAQLLNQGIVSKTKANFGISKNIETLEKSTIELSLAESSTSSGSPKRRPVNCLGTVGYERSPDLYLRRSDDDDDDEDYFPTSDDGERSGESNFVRVKAARPKLPTETVFENNSVELSPISQSNGFRFVEPTTSFHSAYGCDSERIMYEGIS